jgi:hypothetical protein
MSERNYVELIPELVRLIGVSEVDAVVADQRWWTQPEIVEEATSGVCGICLDQGWSCEGHVDRPWSGVVGNDRGCEPDCVGPGLVCRRFKEHGKESDDG